MAKTGSPFEAFTLESIPNEINEEDCKGIFFRATTNMFMSGETIRSTRQLKVLRRMSCSGCEKCGWILEYLQEDIEYLSGDGVDLLDDLKHGKVYGVTFNSSQDWESGYWEIDSFEFVEVVDD